MPANDWKMYHNIIKFIYYIDIYSLYNYNFSAVKIYWYFIVLLINLLSWTIKYNNILYCIT